MSTWELTNLTSQLLLPPGGLIVLAFAGLAFARAHLKLGLGTTFVALLALYLLAMPVVGRSLLHTLQHPYSDPLAVPGGEAIVVLGGGSYSGAPEYGGDTVSRYTLERLRYAAHLQRRSGKPILVSGGNPAGLASSEGEQMRAVLRDFGVNATWVEGASDNTFENARLTQRTLQGAGVTRVYLVTHAWHMPRARMAFDHAGLDVIPAPTGYRTAPVELRTLDFAPNVSALQDSFHFFRERAGMLWYRLRLAAAD